MTAAGRGQTPGPVSSHHRVMRAALARAGRRLPAECKYPFRILLQPRAFHSFCVGCPRTGTASIAGLLKGRYRSAHEPACTELVELYYGMKGGSRTEEQVRRKIVRRDRRLWLEMNSYFLNGLFVRQICQAFPESLFVLTIRDCYSWLDSMYDLMVNHELDRNRQRWLNVRSHILDCSNPITFSAHERVLEERGLFPAGELLRYWHTHNSRILAAIPTGRLLTLRTVEITGSLGRLSAFLGIPEGHLVRSSAHRNRSRERHHLAGRIDPGFLKEQVDRHCGELMTRFFPGVESVRDAH
jgi:hypothetical protein